MEPGAGGLGAVGEYEGDKPPQDLGRYCIGSDTLGTG